MRDVDYRARPIAKAHPLLTVGVDGQVPAQFRGCTREIVDDPGHGGDVGLLRSVEVLSVKP